MPIFLWSIVVNQLNTPVVSRGRRSSRGTGFATTSASASSTVVIRELPGDGRTACASSFEREEEVGDRLRLSRGHAERHLERRHADLAGIGLGQARTLVRLAARRVVDPAPEVVEVEVVLPAGEDRPPVEVRGIVADLSLRHTRQALAVRGPGFP